jgi:hypothetical protein
MKTNSIRWVAAICGALIAEGVLIASSFVWVAIYSYVVNPGQPFAAYQQHAQISGPWVSILVGIPVFYALSRWVARNLPTAMVMLAFVLTIDIAILVLAATSEIPIAMVVVSYLSKLVASYLGGRQATAQLSIATG